MIGVQFHYTIIITVINMQKEMWGTALENSDPSLVSVIAFAENNFQIALLVLTLESTINTFAQFLW